MEGVLVVAVCTKKDYMAVSLPQHPLSDSCWVRADEGNSVTLSFIVIVLLWQDDARVK